MDEFNIAVCDDYSGIGMWAFNTCDASCRESSWTCRPVDINNIIVRKNWN